MNETYRNMQDISPQVLERAERAFAEPAFCRELATAGSVKEAQALLEQKGVTMTPEQTEALLEAGRELVESGLTAEQLRAFSQQMAEGELSEDALENVAGGFILTTLWMTLVTAAPWVSTAAAAYGAGYVAGRLIG